MDTNQMFLRFLLVGGTGFIVDASVTYGLVRTGVDPWIARAPGIGIAMVFTWIANRRFTYHVKARRSAHEGGRYSVVALTMAMVNYLFYVALVGIGAWPVVAVTVATLLQSFISFHAYRHCVFGKPR